MKKSLIKVTFFKANENGTKLQLIAKKGQEAFHLEKKLLILVPNLQAAEYLDKLLWNMPEEGFIPHAISDFSSQEWVVITMQSQKNLNQAPHLLNLSPSPPPLFTELEEIFDLFDETHPQKLEMSKQRLNYYQSQGLTVKLI